MNHLVRAVARSEDAGAKDVYILNLATLSNS